MIRVLVADDSPTARALLVAILSSDPEIEVVGEAQDGVEAVERTQALRPDVVTMDLRMPRLDGFGATKEIMITAPTPIVIITASMLARDVETSMNALKAGALTVLPKPAGPQDPNFEEGARQLLTSIKAMSQVKVVRHWRPTAGPAPAQAEARPAAAPAAVRGRVVALATSTGGPAALHRLLALLPGDFPAPLLAVQHITPGFISGLADWLDKASELRVKVAEDGEPLAPGTVYFAPDDRHLEVAPPATVALARTPPVGGFRPSGTALFESAARVYGAATVAVVLTGMGDDGVEGLRAVRRAGGRVLAQDEKSSVVFGMPAAAAAAGLVDQVLRLEEIAPRLVEFVS
jgi:two-component system chemotaxis response regulator CheB